MNNKKIIIFSLIIILILTFVILIRENQYVQTITEYLNDEIQQEQSRLETSQELVKGYNELQEENDRLYEENLKLKADWEWFVITGYTANDLEQGTNGITAAGFKTDCGLPIAASNCIPLYSIVEIKGLGGFIILDTGLGYKTENGWEDENWIDILFDTKEEANLFGKQNMLVRIIGKEAI